MVGAIIYGRAAPFCPEPFIKIPYGHVTAFVLEPLSQIDIDISVHCYEQVDVFFMNVSLQEIIVHFEPKVNSSM